MKNSCVPFTARLLAFVCAIILCCNVSTAYADAVGHADINPGLLYRYYIGSIEPLGEGSIIVGDPDSGAVSEIIPSTLRINGTIVPTSATLLPSADGFAGQVYELTFSLVDFIVWYEPFFDSTLHDFVVTGQCSNYDYEFPGLVMLRGYSTGDLNRDGRLNIADLSLMTGFLYRGNVTLAEPMVADIDHNGKLNILDVIALVRLLFQ